MLVTPGIAMSLYKPEFGNGNVCWYKDKT